ncbi:hypothetical protein K4V09_12135 [Staphylococcus epidermidis]|nr:hypothetical protein [Staphylococcus epidermidis]MCG2223359.1 hypothetical protein [Staphylococcus epidermidis]
MSRNLDNKYFANFAKPKVFDVERFKKRPHGRICPTVRQSQPSARSS